MFLPLNTLKKPFHTCSYTTGPTGPHLWPGHPVFQPRAGRRPGRRGLHALPLLVRQVARLLLQLTSTKGTLIVLCARQYCARTIRTILRFIYRLRRERGMCVVIYNIEIFRAVSHIFHYCAISRNRDMQNCSLCAYPTTATRHSPVLRNCSLFLPKPFVVSRNSSSPFAK